MKSISKSVRAYNTHTHTPLLLTFIVYLIEFLFILIISIAIISKSISMIIGFIYFSNSIYMVCFVLTLFS